MLLSSTVTELVPAAIAIGVVHVTVLEEGVARLVEGFARLRVVNDGKASDHRADQGVEPIG